MTLIVQSRRDKWASHGYPVNAFRVILDVQSNEKHNDCSGKEQNLPRTGPLGQDIQLCILLLFPCLQCCVILPGTCSATATLQLPPAVVNCVGSCRAETCTVPGTDCFRSGSFEPMHSLVLECGSCAYWVIIRKLLTSRCLIARTHRSLFQPRRRNHDLTPRSYTCAAVAVSYQPLPRSLQSEALRLPYTDLLHPPLPWALWQSKRLWMELSAG